MRYAYVRRREIGSLKRIFRHTEFEIELFINFYPLFGKFNPLIVRREIYMLEALELKIILRRLVSEIRFTSRY